MPYIILDESPGSGWQASYYHVCFVSLPSLAQQQAHLPIFYLLRCLIGMYIIYNYRTVRYIKFNNTI